MDTGERTDNVWLDAIRVKLARRKRMRMRARLVILLSVILSYPVVATLADIPRPIMLRVYFEQNGQPYHKPVRFSINCYGYTAYPGSPEFRNPRKSGSYTPVKVYTIEGKCPDYGCAIRHQLYLNYLHIDYCSLEGTTGKKSFRIDRLPNSPIDESTCTHPTDVRSFGLECPLSFEIPE